MNFIKALHAIKLQVELLRKYAKTAKQKKMLVLLKRYLDKLIDKDLM